MVEGSANRLAHWEVEQVLPSRWCLTKEMIEPLFYRNVNVFTNSWAPMLPLVDQALHLKLLEPLSKVQLGQLRDLLEAFGNHQLTLPCGLNLKPALAVWISQNHKDFSTALQHWRSCFSLVIFCVLV